MVWVASTPRKTPPSEPSPVPVHAAVSAVCSNGQTPVPSSHGDDHVGTGIRKQSSRSSTHTWKKCTLVRQRFELYGYPAEDNEIQEILNSGEDIDQSPSTTFLPRMLRSIDSMMRNLSFPDRPLSAERTRKASKISPSHNSLSRIEEEDTLKSRNSITGPCSKGRPWCLWQYARACHKPSVTCRSACK
jgi:hypothetical protein